MRISLVSSSRLAAFLVFLAFFFAAGTESSTAVIADCAVTSAALDGSEILETSRVTKWSYADAIAAGKEAGAELKKKAPAEFFANLIEHGGSW